MTAVFGILRNDSDDQITLASVKVSTELTSLTELHEMVEDDNSQMVMRENVGGIVVPGGGTHKFDPGGDHLMLFGARGHRCGQVTPSA